MTIDTKALPSSEPKATVALIRRYIAESYEASRTGMTCGIPKAVRVDCAMVERLCRIAEKQADRLAVLEAELANASREIARLADRRAALEVDHEALIELLDEEREAASLMDAELSEAHELNARLEAENQRLRGVLERANIELYERHGLNDYFTDALAAGGVK